MTSRMRRGVLIAVTSGALAAPTIPAATASAHGTGSASGPVVVVSGLNNPRQLSLVHDRVLLIAEAGKGGTLATIADPEGGTEGLGYTGSISAVLRPAHAAGQSPHRIVTGLLSAAAAEASEDGPAGGGATGPDGVSARTLRKIGIIETTFGAATPAAARSKDGHLLVARPHHGVHPIANITGYEADHDPDGLGVDSNPYAVLAYRGGWLVADAAGNDVLYVRHGRRSVFHVFPNVTTGACAGQEDPPGHPGCNFVPTSLASDRHGNVYVGGLSGLTPGEAQVVKLDRRGHKVKRWLGFSAVTGLAVSNDGSLYVSQLLGTPSQTNGLPGVLTRIHHGSRTSVDVPFPAGVATDCHGNVFVSAFSVMPDTGAGIPGQDTSGQVWRLHF